MLQVDDNTVVVDVERTDDVVVEVVVDETVVVGGTLVVDEKKEVGPTGLLVPPLQADTNTVTPRNSA
jgi:hypothetical protein